MGCPALVGMGKEGDDPFSGWVMVQAGMQKLWGQERNIKEPKQELLVCWEKQDQDYSTWSHPLHRKSAQD